MNLLIHYVHQPDEETTNKGQVVFSNPNNKSMGWIEAEMNKNLIGGDFFVPNRLGIPALDGTSVDDVNDSDYHEPVEFEFTDAEPTDLRSIDEFIEEMVLYKKRNPEEFW